MTKKVSGELSCRIVLFLLLALLAAVLMGTTAEAPQQHELNISALQLANESKECIRQHSRELAMQNPGAVLRANVIRPQESAAAAVLD